MTRPLLDRHGAWLAVALAAVLVYANSLANGFALDDTYIIQGNTRVHQLADQTKIWLLPYWPAYGVELGLYRPFAIFLYAVEWAIGGGSPVLFHACNVAFHAMASVLAYHLVRVLVGAGMPALLGGLLFAVHPVRAEAVANIVGQAELVAGACTLGACLIHATRPRTGMVGWGRRLGVVTLFAVAVLTKESAIALPGLLVALDLAQRRVEPSARGVIAYTRGIGMLMFLLVAAAIAYLALRVSVLGSLGGVDAAPSLPFLREQGRVPTALRAWIEYVRLLFFPADLAADYSPAVILPVQAISPLALLGAAILLLTVALALLTPVFPAAGLPAAWFFISILPVSNLLLPIGVVLAERLLYTPAFVVSLIAASGWAHWAARPMAIRARRPLVAAVAVALVLLAGRTFVRNPDWKDTPAVWDALVRDHPESYRSQQIHSARLYSQGDTRAGVAHLEMAHRLWPNDSQVLNDLAYQYLGRGRFHDALPLLERSRRYVPWVPRTEVLLAEVAIGARQYARALDAVIRADRMGVSRPTVFALYAQAYEGLGRRAEAIAAWRAALRQPGTDAWQYWGRLARLLSAHGDATAALAAADSAMTRIHPADTASARVVRELIDTVRRDCYSEPRAKASRAACTDPMSVWAVLVPLSGRNANNSQNASSAGGTVRGAPPDEAL